MCNGVLVLLRPVASRGVEYQGFRVRNSRDRGTGLEECTTHQRPSRGARVYAEIQQNQDGDVVPPGGGSPSHESHESYDDTLPGLLQKMVGPARIPAACLTPLGTYIVV